MPITDTLRGRIEDALNIITQRSPTCLHEVAQMRRALAANSPILAARFRVLVKNAASDEHWGEYTPDEKFAIGEVLADLADSTRETRAGVLQIRLTMNERAELEQRAAAAGMSMAEFIRRRALE